MPKTENVEPMFFLGEGQTTTHQILFPHGLVYVNLCGCGGDISYPRPFRPSCRPRLASVLSRAPRGDAPEWVFEERQLKITRTSAE